jgi:hypothetical protein
VKAKTEKIDDVLRQILAGENADELISSLSEAEKSLFYQLLTSIRQENDLSILDQLWRVDYKRKPPTMHEFLFDPYWLGNVTSPQEGNSGIFPIWQKALEEDFDLDSRIHNLVITGSLGIGKTWNMGIIFLYRLVMAVLLRDPQAFLGLSRGSTISYVVLSISKGVVEETAFGDIKNFMERSPFFVEECHFNPNLKYSNLRIDLPNNILLTAGSKSQHVIGRNTLGVCLDEGNWRLEANPDLKAYKLYDEVRTRIKNRFQKTAGFLPAISILASSARDESSFTEKVIKDIEEANDPKTEKVYRFSVFQARRHLLKLKPRWFKVAYGLKSVDPTLLAGWYNEDGTPLDGARHEDPPAGCRTVLVPEDYLDAFKRNCKTALQSICGISTGGSHLLFPSTTDVERCLELAEKDGVQNPARVELMPISMEDQAEIWDFLDHRKFLTQRYSQVIPLRHPEAKRFAHLDLATASMAGLAVCHLVNSQRVDGLVKDGIIYSEYRLVVEYDFILTIVAGKSKPISLEKIQRFFFWLRQECGFNFGLVTADSWQSAMPLQMMQARGFETKLLSLDRQKAPYYAWRTGFEELRIRLYPQRQLLREIETLLDLPEKVDHPADGSKDTSDAAAGAYWNAINYEKFQGSPSGTEPAIYPDLVLSQGLGDAPPIDFPLEAQVTPQPAPLFQA